MTPIKSKKNLFDGVDSARLDATISEDATKILADYARLSAQRLFNLGDPPLQSLLLEEFPELIPQEVKDRMVVSQMELPLEGELSLPNPRDTP